MAVELINAVRTIKRFNAAVFGLFFRLGIDDCKCLDMIDHERNVFTTKFIKYHVLMKVIYVRFSYYFSL